MSRKMSDSISAYILLSPILIGLLIFSYYPPLKGLVLAFFDWELAGNVWEFVGLKHFRTMLHDEVLIASVPHMLFLLIGGIVIGVTAPFVMAELVFFVKNERMKYIYRVLILVPMVIPGIVGMLVWQFIYDPNTGLVNSILDGIGLGEWKRSWLGSPDTVLWALLFIGFPWVTGIGPLIYLSGLMNIPTEVIESSRLDGASNLRRVFAIDIPLVVGQIKFFVVTGLIGGLQAFGTQLVLTDGGPGYASMVPGYHMYMQAFHYGRYGYASAIGLMLFIVALVFTVANMKLIKSQEDR